LLGRVRISFITAAKAVVPDELRVLVEQRDDFAGKRGRHISRGRIEPDDCREISIAGE